ncbi:orf 41 [Ateline gammaherpesvirus 3]|uniref:Orf 41 n=1 Tax=Ateline herpesvirus 3 TaxID=85618 RepID=Q9YTM4_ATHV3|nr:orf 41 [Ateline gammaherpesvirus 3]AAC95567.1 orf 41 [Ateline gammaherpesvirus 3]
MTSEASLFLQTPQRLFCGFKKCHLTSDQLQTHTWLGSIESGLSILLCTKCNLSVCDVFETLLPLYFENRHNAKFWLVPKIFLTSLPQKPHIPSDCISPTLFFFTTEGPVCWHQKQNVPININYGEYLHRALLVFEKVPNVTIDKEICNRVEGWKNILHLL